MLNNFLLSLQAVLPMFIIIFVGYFIRRKDLISDAQVKAFNKIIFIVCFPCLSFDNIYGKNITGADYKVVWVTLLALAIIYALGTVIVLSVEKDSRSRGAMIQAIYRSNVVIMGISMVQNLFGSDIDISITAIIIAIVVPVYNVLAVITLEIYRGGRLHLKDILISIATNPIIIGSAAGILAVIFGLTLPEVMYKPVASLADAASPMALLVLGASFNLKSLSSNIRNVAICVIGRLIVAPSIGLFLLYTAGIRGVALATAVAVFASPTAVASYTMAQQMDSNGELAGECVVVSSLFSCFTMFMWVFILKCTGLI